MASKQSVEKHIVCNNIRQPTLTANNEGLSISTRRQLHMVSFIGIFFYCSFES